MIGLSYPNQTEKFLAAIAHACVLIPFWGIIGAIGIWFAQKRYSRFIAFQSLQAVVYQLVVSVFVGLSIGVYTSFLTFYLLFIPAAEQNSGDFSPLIILGPSFCIGLFLWVYIGYGLWGAVSVWRGYNFQYLIIGSRIKNRFRGSDSIRS